MANLTELAIKALKPGTSRREVPDGLISGLYLALQPTGAASWVVRYRFGKAPRKLTLGRYPAISLKDARKLAQEALVAVARGEDVAAAKQAAKTVAPAPIIRDRLDDVVKAYLAREAKAMREASRREITRLLEGEILAAWPDRRLSEITQSDVHDFRDAITDGTRKWRPGAGPAPILANRAFAAFRQVCNWAVERGLLERSPCEKVRATPERSRDRVLSDQEIKPTWQAAETIRWPFGDAIKLLLLTGARRDEVSEMRWPEVDIAAGTWTLPASRTKNGVAHVIPLSRLALEILENLPRVEGDFVFTTNGKTAVSGWSRAKTQMDREIANLCGGAPIPHWQIHDLRRTAASTMAGLGVAPHVVEAVLNHKSGTIRGVAAVYNRYAYAAEKRHALEALARAIEAIVNGEPAASNVVALAAARAADGR
jgi:integrase